MILTDAQKTIIKQICSIQFDSLEEVLKKKDLGIMSDGTSYQQFFDEMGIDRLDFDHELINTVESFRRVNHNPEVIFEVFEIIDFEIFDYIMDLYREEIILKYPKAFENLKDKIFIWKQVNLRLQ